MKLEKWMEVKGISNSQLSRMSGVPIRTIEDIKQRGSCRLDTARKLAESINVDLYDLATLEDKDDIYISIHLPLILDLIYSSSPNSIGDYQFRDVVGELYTYENNHRKKFIKWLRNFLQGKPELITEQ